MAVAILQLVEAVLDCEKTGGVAAGVPGAGAPHKKPLLPVGTIGGMETQGAKKNKFDLIRVGNTKAVQTDRFDIPTYRYKNCQSLNSIVQMNRRIRNNHRKIYASETLHLSCERMH